MDMNTFLLGIGLFADTIYCQHVDTEILQRYQLQHLKHYYEYSLGTKSLSQKVISRCDSVVELLEGKVYLYEQYDSINNRRIESLQTLLLTTRSGLNELDAVHKDILDLNEKQRKRISGLKRSGVIYRVSAFSLLGVTLLLLILR